ncbi:MAG: HD domain-containing protein [Clostridia bacterium]
MNDISKIKEKMLQYEKNLSINACTSKDAIRLKNTTKDIRSEYERDVDKIIHALSYTRYIDKTQVHSDLQNDNISKRMTHVQFVSRAARTICRALELNEDLAEAIALGHDTGHVPFGHVGEKILSDISVKKTGKYFLHNLNSVRVLDVLEKNGNGLNLTLQTLDGIMCHNGELVQSHYKPVKKDFYTLFEEYSKCIKDPKYLKNIKPMTLEGCVVRISDLIGYLGKDIDDAVMLGVIDIKDIPKNITNVLGTKNDEIMNNIIIDVIENSFNKPYIEMSKKMYEAISNLKEFNYENIYSKVNSAKDLQKFKDIFEKLFEVYIKAVETSDLKNDIYTTFLKNMNKNYLMENSNEQKVIDYISGMTDSFIEKQYEKYVMQGEV